MGMDWSELLPSKQYEEILTLDLVVNYADYGLQVKP